MVKLADLVVPEAGRITDVLPWIRSLCQEMEEAQNVCEGLHSRLMELYVELQKREQ